MLSHEECGHHEKPAPRWIRASRQSARPARAAGLADEKSRANANLVFGGFVFARLFSSTRRLASPAVGRAGVRLVPPFLRSSVRVPLSPCPPFAHVSAAVSSRTLSRRSTDSMASSALAIFAGGSTR